LCNISRCKFRAFCFASRNDAGGGMSRTFDARRHEALRAFMVERRKIAGLRQVDLAKRLGRS
jgi:hypothetical protein